MIRNYLLIAWRNLSRNKLYTVINLSGLTIGIACCLLILLFIRHELSYDRFHKNAERIYRLTEVLHLPKGDNARAVTSPPMAPALREAFPEIEKAARINLSSRILSANDKKLPGIRIIYADPDFLDIFTLPPVTRDNQRSLTEPFSIVLTESTARKFFGETNVTGRRMQLSDTIALTISSVIHDVPGNSHFTFDCILSGPTLYKLSGSDMKDEWYYNNFYTYLLLREHTDVKDLESRITAHIATNMAEFKKTTGLGYDLKLQPLTRIHLESDLNSEISVNGNILYVYIFSAAALLILLIACCIFINLSTAKSLNRAKEIGLRKVIGAQRRQLVFQFLGESVLFAFLATLFAIALSVILLPAYNTLTGQSFSVTDVFAPPLLMALAIILTGAGLAAGIYPALLMSSFRPVTTLKGQLRHEWKDVLLRKGLVVFQFVIATVLIIGSFFIYQQLRFIQSKKLGLNKEQVVEFELDREAMAKAGLLKEKISKLPGVQQASLTDFTFRSEMSTIAVLPEGFADNEVASYSVISIDENFLKTFQVQLAAGRDFSKEFQTDPKEAFLVNEAAVREFGWISNEQALGKKIDWGLGKKGKVIGVVKDFNFASLHESIRPLILHIEPEFYGMVAFRIKPDNTPSTLASIRESWKNTTGVFPESFSFLDEDFARLYETESRMQSILIVFTTLSVFVACLGLFGLTAFTVRQRFREIGIRKVLGAGTTVVVSLLSKDLMRLVLLSILLATPLAWLSVSRWLDNFAYRVSVSGWNFVFAGVLALLIAFVTIGLQSVRAAVSNPLKSLRSE